MIVSMTITPYGGGVGGTPIALETQVLPRVGDHVHLRQRGFDGVVRTVAHAVVLVNHLVDLDPVAHGAPVVSSGVGIVLEPLVDVWEDDPETASTRGDRPGGAEDPEASSGEGGTDEAEEEIEEIELLDVEEAPEILGASGRPESGGGAHPDPHTASDTLAEEGVRPAGGGSGAGIEDTSGEVVEITASEAFAHDVQTSESLPVLEESPEVGAPPVVETHHAGHEDESGGTDAALLSEAATGEGPSTIGLLPDPETS